MPRKGSVQAALPDTSLAKLCRCFILRRSESTSKWEEEKGREGLVSAEEHGCAWEVELGRQLVLGDDLQGEIPGRNAPETGCSVKQGIHVNWNLAVLLLGLQK